MPSNCGRCGTKVYAAEERLGLNKSWHIRCFTCASCNRTLDSFTLAENRECDEIYCKVCYRKRFATKGYGYGPNEPTLTSTMSAYSFCREEYKENEVFQEDAIKEIQNTHLNFPSAIQTNCTSKNVSLVQVPQTPLRIASPIKSPAEKCTNSKVEVKASGIQVPKSTSNQTKMNCLSKLEGKTNESRKDCLASTSQQQQSSKVMIAQAISEGKLAVAVKTSSQRSPVMRESSTKKLKQGSSRRLGGGEPCKRCQRPVYWAEMKLGRCGAYHQECFSCCSCGKALESTTVSENGGEIFCKGCYRRFFATHGCGYGLGAGALQTP